jgi:hypothetical protein
MPSAASFRASITLEIENCACLLLDISDDEPTCTKLDDRTEVESVNIPTLVTTFGHLLLKICPLLSTFDSFGDQENTIDYDTYTDEEVSAEFDKFHTAQGFIANAHSFAGQVESVPTPSENFRSFLNGS